MVFSRKETSFTPCVNEWIHPRGCVGLAAQHSWIRLEIVDHAVAARFLSAAAMVPAAKVWPAPHPAIGHLGLPFGDHDSQVAVTPWAGAAQIFCLQFRRPITVKDWSHIVVLTSKTSVAVELYLVEPVFAVGKVLDGERIHGFDETGLRWR
jgi:hypothetical protein